MRRQAVDRGNKAAAQPEKAEGGEDAGGLAPERPPDLPQQRRRAAEHQRHGDVDRPHVPFAGDGQHDGLQVRDQRGAVVRGIAKGNLSVQNHFRPSWSWSLRRGSRSGAPWPATAGRRCRAPVREKRGAPAGKKKVTHLRERPEKRVFPELARIHDSRIRLARHAVARNLGFFHGCRIPASFRPCLVAGRRRGGAGCMAAVVAKPRLSPRSLRLRPRDRSQRPPQPRRAAVRGFHHADPGRVSRTQLDVRAARPRDLRRSHAGRRRAHHRRRRHAAAHARAALAGVGRGDRRRGRDRERRVATHDSLAQLPRRHLSRHRHVGGRLRSRAAPCRLAMAPARRGRLFLGGINKLNYQLVAWVVCAAWALRAGLVRQAGWARVLATLAGIAFVGVALPLAAELAWTGASLKLWFANVVTLPAGARTGILREISPGISGCTRSTIITDRWCCRRWAWWPCGSCSAPCWAAGRRRRPPGGAALLATNFEIAPPRTRRVAGAGRQPVAGLRAGAPRRRFRRRSRPARRGARRGRVVWSAWLGQRSQFGYSQARALSMSPRFPPGRPLPTWPAALPPELVMSLKTGGAIAARAGTTGATGRFSTGWARSFWRAVFPPSRRRASRSGLHWHTSYDGCGHRPRGPAKWTSRDGYRVVAQFPGAERMAGRNPRGAAAKIFRRSGRAGADPVDVPGSGLREPGRQLRDDRPPRRKHRRPVHAPGHAAHGFPHDVGWPPAHGQQPPDQFDPPADSPLTACKAWPRSSACREPGTVRRSWSSSSSPTAPRRRTRAGRARVELPAGQQSITVPLPGRCLGAHGGTVGAAVGRRLPPGRLFLRLSRIGNHECRGIHRRRRRAAPAHLRPRRDGGDAGAGRQFFWPGVVASATAGDAGRFRRTPGPAAGARRRGLVAHRRP